MNRILRTGSFAIEVSSLVSGTAGDDTLMGSGGADVLEGFGGEDDLRGGAGADDLYGDSGDDTLAGGSGADWLDGGSGFDLADYYYAAGSVTVDLLLGRASGGAGNDTLSGIEDVAGGEFDDALYGDGGGNWLYGDEGNDVLSGGAGNDTLDGSAGSDVLSGGDGFDLADYYFAASAVTVDLLLGRASGGAGNDTLSGIEDVAGSAFGDSLYGDASGNWLYGDTGNDLLSGGGGSDTLEGGVGNDILHGGAGFDVADYYYAAAAVFVNLMTGEALGGAGHDTLTGVEDINGSFYNDVLSGDTVGNFLYGDAGNDTLKGGAGNDTLEGGLGNDRLIGGAGNDSVDYGFATAAVTVNLDRGSARGGDGSDVLVSIENASGSAYADTLLASSGNNLLDGGAGTDTVSYQHAATGVTVSLAITSAQATGGSGNDILLRVERLTGSGFDDSLSGNAAANVLKGGNGNDTLTGGAGADAFVFDTPLSASNVDTITDFASPRDSLRLDDDIFTQLTAGAVLTEDQFYAAANASSGHDANDRIIYDTVSGALYYDADGNASGAAVKFAILGTTTHPTVTAADFALIA